VADHVSKAGYELEFEDTFDGAVLDESRWLRQDQPDTRLYTPQYGLFELRAKRSTTPAVRRGLLPRLPAPLGGGAWRG
jgi:hypothetical protein